MTFDSQAIPGAGAVCSLCGKPISGKPVTSSDSDHLFDTRECYDTYRKLAGLYGSNVLVSDAFNYEVASVNLFFIDIVLG